MWAKLLALPQSPAWDRWVFLGFVVLAVLGVGVLWKVPQWQVARVEGLDSKERFDKRNEARKTLATILGGVAFLTGGYFTWRNFNLAQESLRVSQQGQITDRFTKAIEQLGAVDSQGKPKFEVRLGGIYSLEAIAKDSKDLHWPIMEVLCSYVRGNAPAQPPANPASAGQKKSGSQGTTSQPEVHPRADIQAILTVLGRRDAWQENENQRLDLSGTDLAGPDLRHAHLKRADFARAYLTRADLTQADLSGAYLIGAYLTRANLSGADLSGADLSWADLSGAYLSRANLSGANLKDAKGADVALAQTSIVPESGQFTGWKKCVNNVLVRLIIGKKARRSSAAGRKCRAEYVKVAEVIGAEVGISLYDNKTEYRVGQIVRCDKWNEDRWTECGGGIHFYLTRIEAENHS